MRARQYATGALAVLVLAGILIGLPAVLVALGAHPLPAGLPTWDQVRAGLLSPDDGTLALAAIKVLAWTAWAGLAVTILLEVIAQVARRPAPRLPGLSMPQGTVQALVATALALFIAAPHTPPPASAAPATSSSGQQIPAVAASVPSLVAAVHTGTDPATPGQPGSRTSAARPGHDAPDHPVAPETTYTVRPGDTLWSIAEHHLGSGRDYHAIVALNAGVLTGGPDWITPGMQLRLPSPTASVAGLRHVVVPGDTLSALAAHYLGDGATWPDIYRASTGIAQPDGDHLSDPDLIRPGWQLVIPGTHSAEPVAQPRTTPQNGPADPPGPGTGPAPTHLGVKDHPDRKAAPSPVASVQAGAARTAPAASSPGGPRETETPATGQQQKRDLAVQGDATQPAWMLAGLIGSGALLGGGVFLTLASRRRAQSRHRRPSRTITTPEAGLAPVEKTVQTAGATAAVTLTMVDDVLRRLGATCRNNGTPVPDLTTVHLADGGLTVHLSAPADFGEPWVPSQDGSCWTLPPGIPVEQVGPADFGEPWVPSQDKSGWTLPPGTPADQVGPAVADQPAPYPLLVTIGAGDDGSTWLLNLEELEVHLTGEEDYVHDLARYVAAEIAVNPWSAGVRLDLVGIAQEVAPMNPTRVRVGEHTCTAGVVAHVVDVLDRLDPTTDVTTARVTQAGEDTWPARMILLDAADAENTPTHQLRGLVADHPGRTSASLVVHGGQPAPGAVTVQVTGTGRVLLPKYGLDLVAVGLTSDEARGIAALLEQGAQLDDTPMPTPGDDGYEDSEHGWRAWADQAGALRTEHTLPRPTDDDTDAGEQHPPWEVRVTGSLLDEPDQEYLDTGATTAMDLNALAPLVLEDVKTSVAGVDPRLDADLASWWDENSRLPKLTLLGPVAARTRGTPLVDRKPYFTELLAYLALRPHGATSEETGEAFGISPAKCRDYVAKCRDWLGTNPRTGNPHLPHAQKAPAARTRGGGVYQVLDVLVDADLFRRLRLRGQAHGGAEGIADLREALRLVQGRPFTQLRPGGWAWLFEGDRLDQHLVCGIVDVAHTLVTHDLQAGDTESARLAAETASLAAPHEEIPTLDLAAVAAAEGHHDQAARLLTERVCNRTDDQDSVPGDLPARTKNILDRHPWVNKRQAS